MIEGPATPSAAPESAASALAACPHLASVDGAWHGATPSRAHRCRLLSSGRPTLDRQREHCLTSAHITCPTWLEAHGGEGLRTRPGPFVPMAPVVLEGPGLGRPSDATARRLVGPAMLVVVGIALGAFLLARGALTPGSSGAGDDGASPTPAPTLATATVTPSAGPTTAPTASPTGPPTPTPRPSATPRPRTYTVRPGDTLSGIAAKFGTTVAKIAALNNITNPSMIHAGQVLKIP